MPRLFHAFTTPPSKEPRRPNSIYPKRFVQMPTRPTYDELVAALWQLRRAPTAPNSISDAPRVFTVQNAADAVLSRAGVDVWSEPPGLPIDPQYSALTRLAQKPAFAPTNGA